MIRRRAKSRSGQSLVEFAFMLPILVLLLIGLADFGFLFYAHVQVTNATREGARAGSLYLGGRFHYTSCFSNCPAGYGNGGACWQLRDWVENGLVERNRASNGCPATGFDTTVHSFGLLNVTTQCPAANSGTDCWWLAPLVFTADPAATTGPVLPLAGTQLQVRVVYRFTPPLLGDLLGLEQNPISVARTVIMKVQNN
jgi:hypothetical protein